MLAIRRKEGKWAITTLNEKSERDLRSGYHPIANGDRGKAENVHLGPGKATVVHDLVDNLGCVSAYVCETAVLIADPDSYDTPEYDRLPVKYVYKEGVFYCSDTGEALSTEHGILLLGKKYYVLRPKKSTPVPEAMDRVIRYETELAQAQ